MKTRVLLAGSWISLVLLYIYADIFSLYRPMYLNHIMDGFMGPLKADQMNILIAAVLMVLPIIMIILSLILQKSVCRIVNIVLPIIYLAVNISNIIGEKWFYYLLYGGIEIIIVIYIFYISLKWKNMKLDK